MNDIITFNKDFSKTILEAQFSSVKLFDIKQSIFSSFVYMIDSKARISSRLDLFLQKQLLNPSDRVRKLANELAVYKKGKLDADATIIAILQWVYKNILYLDDKTNFGAIEYWASADTVLQKRKDDCDGLNSLIYILARVVGIPNYVLYNHIGMARYRGKEEGHYYLSYYSPTLTKLVAIDATFLPYMGSVNLRPQYKDITYYDKPWYIFNDNIQVKCL